VTARGALLALALWAAPALAAGTAGDFDFYVLALSWSPGYCLTDSVPDASQCGSGLRRAFVVHGLWPQYEMGYPTDCDSTLSRNLDPAERAAARAVMPSQSLAIYEWRRHGLCTGLSATRYFALTAAAVARVTIPPAVEQSATRLSPRQIEDAFAAANPGMARTGLSVQCTAGMLTEVRICLTRNLGFRACGEVDARSCRASSLAIPPDR
jgi:ribonuclease T2